MNAILRFCETLRRLRPSQPAHRLVRRCSARRRPSADPSARWVGVAPLPDEARRPRSVPFDRPVDGSPIAPTWSFAGALACVGPEGALAWARQPATALERYHAAYGEVVRACVEDGRVAEAERWLGAIDVESHPYVRSRRILALVEARARGLVAAEPTLRRDAEALFACLERDVRGNHLLANAVALHRVGHAFEGAAARRWCDLGRTLLTACARDQVLEDGVHYERSPSYQGLVLEHLLVALETSASKGVAPPAGVEDAARRLGRALAELVLPDGRLMCRGDGAPGLALPTDALLAWVHRRGAPPAPVTVGTRLLPAAGFGIVEDRGTRSAISLLAGSPCPRELPAHGHADALACEIVLGGVRVIASAGTAAYGEGEARDADRRPGAFAGALLDGRAPADPYGAFRMGVRGWVRRLARWDEDGVTSLDACSGGFSRRGDPVVHRRVVALAGDVAVILDEWTGRGGALAELAWPCLPGLSASIDAHGATLRGEAGTFRWWSSRGDARVERGRYATGLGSTVDRDVIWSRGPIARPARWVHVLAPGADPVDATVTPAPGGALRVTIRGAGSEREFHVSVGAGP